MKKKNILLFEDFASIDAMPFVIAKIKDTPYSDMDKRELLDVIIELKDEIENLPDGDSIRIRLKIELAEAQEVYDEKFS